MANTAILTNPRGANSTALPFANNLDKLPREVWPMVTNSAITGNAAVIHIPHATAPTGKVTAALSSSDSLLFAGVVDTKLVGASAGDTVQVVTHGVAYNCTTAGAIVAGEPVQLSAAATGTFVVQGTNTNPVVGFALTTAASNKAHIFLFGPSGATATDLAVVDDLTVGDALTVTGTTTLNGNVLLGNSASLDTVTITADVTFADAADITVNATTGTKIGTATTQKIGFYNATPVVQPSAYTQTFATADKTHAARTATVLTDNSAGTANTTIQALSDGTTYANDVAAIRNNFADLAASNNAIIVDLADTASVLNSLIDDLQALGLVG